MPGENVEIVQRFLDRAAEAPDEVWDIFDEDVVWELVGYPDFPLTSRGPDQVREFFRRWIGAFEDWGYEVIETIEAGDAVTVRIRQWGRGKGSGAAVENNFWQVWIMRDGKAVRVIHRADKAAALEAAKPRE